MIVFVDIGGTSINLANVIHVSIYYDAVGHLKSVVFQGALWSLDKTIYEVSLIEYEAVAFKRFWEGAAVEHEDYTIVKIGPEITKYRLHLPATKGDVSDE